MKKLLCLLLCLSVLFSTTAVFVGAEDFRPPCEEADSNPNFDIEGWYPFFGANLSLENSARPCA